MKTVLKHIVAHTYKPLLVKYLSKTRTYRYGDISISIPPQVFHPGFFYSTRLLLKEIKKLQLQNKNFLELGAGSGLIAICTAKWGAMVTATDINPIATEYLQSNSLNNKTEIEIIHSDLFDNIPVKKYDIIAINPPYYKKQPQSASDYAWYCGKNGEYFFKLFEQLPSYIHEETEIIMVLCDGCDITMIKSAAARQGFLFQQILTQTTILEKNFIYKIRKENWR